MSMCELDPGIEDQHLTEWKGCRVLRLATSCWIEETAENRKRVCLGLRSYTDEDDLWSRPHVDSDEQ
uniref:Uncharacterized protein n=1 Tax=Chromera velia CCMP2878 TaxID=1169474 RepID=A0A0G4GYI3_9ALVE|eukprot:Cvel_23886.t1-p1 / transcript=Cvel_23886.t1 / gene=Cvel_23886 / organism=Chromera_velia_CCMP2878 / gene_product=hypothetical protein / transcript_product=hypothetical protein / location=Cvel_scaffold2516:4169-4923(-) / protein_length=66 / sequence_SO=supercontig / SO=protein_coding / is_pseudo=false